MAFIGAPAPRGQLRDRLKINRVRALCDSRSQDGDAEYLSRCFEAVLADQFDAYIWFEETNAATPLPAERPQGVPETYRFGL